MRGGCGGRVWGKGVGAGCEGRVWGEGVGGGCGHCSPPQLC